MDGRLFEAAVTGNVSLLDDLLEENATILDAPLVGGRGQETPLHIAANLGHVAFVRRLLDKAPAPADSNGGSHDCPGHELDSKGRTPLHLACRNGHKDVVSDLLEKGANVHFVRDNDGRTPLHMAAMEGHVDIVKMLLDKRPSAVWMVTNDGDPILHFCVKHRQFNAVQELLKMLRTLPLNESSRHTHENLRNFVNLKDEQGNTVLHVISIEAYNKLTIFQESSLSIGRRVDFSTPKTEVVKDLSEGGLDVNAINKDGSTALDIILEKGGGIRRFAFVKDLCKVGATTRMKINGSYHPKRVQAPLADNESKSLKNYRQALLVVMGLLATVIFQAALTPIGGVWQDDERHYNTTNCDVEATPNKVNHTAGQAIMCSTNPKDYEVLNLFISGGVAIFVVTTVFLMLNDQTQGLTLVALVGVFALMACVDYIVSYTMVFNGKLNTLDRISRLVVDPVALIIYYCGTVFAVLNYLQAHFLWSIYARLE